jgi:hypothetical protein
VISCRKIGFILFDGIVFITWKVSSSRQRTHRFPSGTALRKEFRRERPSRR